MSDQLIQNSQIGWLQGEVLHHQPSAFQLVQGLCACGQQFSRGGGVLPVKTT